MESLNNVVSCEFDLVDTNNGTWLVLESKQSIDLGDYNLEQYKED